MAGEKAGLNFQFVTLFYTSTRAQLWYWVDSDAETRDSKASTGHGSNTPEKMVAV